MRRIIVLLQHKTLALHSLVRFYMEAREISPDKISLANITQTTIREVSIKQILVQYLSAKNSFRDLGGCFPEKGFAGRP